MKKAGYLPEEVKEFQPAYKTEEGLYTLEDYYALSDERRVELIDGVFYDMASPSGPHQIIAGRLFNIIQNFIDKRKGRCRVIISPLDVQLDCDNRTMVQPDVIILCDMAKFKNRCIMGAPDFLAEVLSKGTVKKDSSLKLFKYRSAGVREYWMIDPFKEQVTVYCFEKKAEPDVYDFDSKIKIGIYDGALEIDFSVIKDDLADFN